VTRPCRCAWVCDRPTHAMIVCGGGLTRAVYLHPCMCTCACHRRQGVPSVPDIGGGRGAKVTHGGRLLGGRRRPWTFMGDGGAQCVLSCPPAHLPAGRATVGAQRRSRGGSLGISRPLGCLRKREAVKSGSSAARTWRLAAGRVPRWTCRSICAAAVHCRAPCPYMSHVLCFGPCAGIFTTSVFPRRRTVR
jgi:hypothetical protein